MERRIRPAARNARQRAGSPRVPGRRLAHRQQGSRYISHVRNIYEIDVHDKRSMARSVRTAVLWGQASAYAHRSPELRHAQCTKRRRTFLPASCTAALADLTVSIDCSHQKRPSSAPFARKNRVKAARSQYTCYTTSCAPLRICVARWWNQRTRQSGRRRPSRRRLVDHRHPLALPQSCSVVVAVPAGTRQKGL